MRLNKVDKKELIRIRKSIFKVDYRLDQNLKSASDISNFNDWFKIVKHRLTEQETTFLTRISMELEHEN